MIRILFEGAAPVEAQAGETLLAVAQRAGQLLEGTCGGQMACATCHVIVAPEDFGRLRPPSADEEDMLDFARDPVRTSRLACQIVIGPELDGLKVRSVG